MKFLQAVSEVLHSQHQWDKTHRKAVVILNKIQIDEEKKLPFLPYLSMKSFQLLSVLCMVFSVISCSRKEKETVIQGKIPNLPDGMLYIYKDNPSQRIDSVKTIGGNFKLTHQWKAEEVPGYIGIDHIDRKGVLRAFSFPTHAKYRNGDWESQFFMNDPHITINGNIKDFVSKNIQLSENYKLVTGPEIAAGNQTEALFNVDADLFENIKEGTAQTVKEKIVKYPYSFHLLKKINENKNSFSARQVEDFLESFKGDITQSDLYEKLQVYNQKRSDKNNIPIPQLEDHNGVKRDIADKSYKKHLIIFWASWCGPCRQEIPMLKKIRSSYGNEIELVSVSIDTDKKAWQKALKEEKMNWKQLIISNNNTEKEALQIHFMLNQAIPYTVLVDDNFKIISASTGLSDEKELKKLIGK